MSNFKKYYLMLLFVFCVGLFFVWPSQKIPLTGRTFKRPNIVLITVDTLRADYLGCYGYSATPERAISPFIDKLAQEGFRFENCFVQCPITLPSHSSILTGLNPTTHQVRDNLYYALDPKFETLAEILKRNGYTTVAIIGAEPLKASTRKDEGYGLSQGFDIYDDQLPSQENEFEIFFPERTADEITDLAQNYLKTRSSPEKPFFLWLHYFDPHAQYRPPAIHHQFRSLHGKEYDAYAGEVNFTDFEIGRLISVLNLEETLVVLTADHGEGLGEHNEESHGTFLFDSTLRVPLLMTWKGQIFPGVSSQQVRSIDIAPTILDLISLEHKPEIKVPLMEGNSLSAYLRRTWKSPQEQESYGETFYGFQNFNWKIQRSVRTPERKYIEGFRDHAIWFDLKADTKEEKEYVSDSNLQSYVALLKKHVDAEFSNQNTLERMDEKYAGPYWSMPPATPSVSQKNPDVELPVLLKEMNQALNLAEIGKYEDSLTLCETILKQDSTNIAIWNLKAKLLSSDQVKRYREGAEVFEQLMQLRPELTKLCIHGIIHNYIRLQKFESAKKQLERMEMLEKQGILKRDYQTYNFLAFLQLEEGEVEKALRTLELSWKDLPKKNPIAEYYRSQAYFRLGRLKEGAEALKRCLNENESFAPGFEIKEAYIRELLKKGIAFIAEQQFLDAEILFQQAIELGEHYHSRYYVALIYMRTARKSAATALFTQLLKEFPEYHDAYFYLAYLLLEASRLDEGTWYLKEAVNRLDQCYEDHREEIIAVIKPLLEIFPKHSLSLDWSALLKRVSSS